MKHTTDWVICFSMVSAGGALQLIVGPTYDNVHAAAGYAAEMNAAVADNRRDFPKLQDRVHYYVRQAGI